MTARRTRTIGGVYRYVLLLLPCLRMGVPNPVETTRPLVLFLGESIRPHPPEEIVAIHPGSMAIECGGTRCFLRLFFLGTLAKDVAFSAQVWLTQMSQPLDGGTSPQWALERNFTASRLGAHKELVISFGDSLAPGTYHANVVILDLFPGLSADQALLAKVDQLLTLASAATPPQGRAEASAVCDTPEPPAAHPVDMQAKADKQRIPLRNGEAALHSPGSCFHVGDAFVEALSVDDIFDGNPVWLQYDSFSNECDEAVRVGLYTINDQGRLRLIVDATGTKSQFSPHGRFHEERYIFAPPEVIGRPSIFGVVPMAPELMESDLMASDLCMETTNSASVFSYFHALAPPSLVVHQPKFECVCMHVCVCVCVCMYIYIYSQQR